VVARETPRRAAAHLRRSCLRTACTEPGGHVRLRYARASTARQSLDSQLDSLAAAGVTRVFSEKISTRATKRPELEKAVTLAREIRASGVAVTLVVHEHKRLGRGIDLATLAEELCGGCLSQDSGTIPRGRGHGEAPGRTAVLPGASRSSGCCRPYFTSRKSPLAETAGVLGVPAKL